MLEVHLVTGAHEFQEAKMGCIVSGVSSARKTHCVPIYCSPT